MICMELSKLIIVKWLGCIRWKRPMLITMTSLPTISTDDNDSCPLVPLKPSLLSACERSADFGCGRCLPMEAEWAHWVPPSPAGAAPRWRPVPVARFAEMQLLLPLLLLLLLPPLMIIIIIFISFLYCLSAPYFSCCGDPWLQLPPLFPEGRLLVTPHFRIRCALLRLQL